MIQTGRRGSLWKISVSIEPESEDAVGELLANIFDRPASIYSDFEKHHVVASVFVERVPPAQIRELRDGIDSVRCAGLGTGSGRITVRRIPRENWAESWKRHFQPLEIRRKLLVIPSWSRRKPKPGQAVVVIDPGLSFGTGQHATTAFCLDQLVILRSDARRQSLLDIGCGSGILSIAAARLGYAPVSAFDFDPDAVRIARENARLNSMRIHVAQHDLGKLPLRKPRLFDVVCANLIYDLLIEQRRRITQRLRADGTLVLAGILKKQFFKVRRAYEACGLELIEARTGREWKSGTFRWRPE